jgi:hypothetical protein
MDKVIPQERFNEFLSDIEPSSTTKQNASSSHTTLREYLADHENFIEFHVRTFLSGSYKRDTAIRPRKKNGDTERPDVDIIVETNHTLDDNPADLVDLLYKTLKKRYSNIRRQSRSVGIGTSKADMDVVPIIAPYGNGGQLYIPDRKLEQWLKTNPPEHTQWTIDTNAKSEGRFKPLVKMMKWWRRVNPTISKRPKGFVIECIVAECMDDGETYYGELLVKTLEEIVEKYSTYIAIKSLPFIQDPGVPENSVTNGMTFEAFEGFYNKAKTHAEIGRRALESENAEKATELWRKIFGDRFPSGKTKKSEDLLEAPIVASPTLTFPDRPVRPNKPQGFA